MLVTARRCCLRTPSLVPLAANKAQYCKTNVSLSPFLCFYVIFCLEIIKEIRAGSSAVPPLPLSNRVVPVACPFLNLGKGPDCWGLRTATIPLPPSLLFCSFCLTCEADAATIKMTRGRRALDFRVVWSVQKRPGILGCLGEADCLCQAGRHALTLKRCSHKPCLRLLPFLLLFVFYFFNCSLFS